MADALINKISSFSKIEYIRMFDQLKMRIEQKVKDIEEAIANGADYVAEMKSVLQKGVETLNAIVADGKSDIQNIVTQAKTDLTKVKDNATEDINTTANNAKTSVQDTASTSINAINATTTEATEHVDTKVTEFNQTVEDNGFLSPQILDEELENLEWQKYKLTKDNGAPFTLNEFDFNDIDALETGNYLLTAAINPPFKLASYSFLKIEKATGNTRKAIATPINSNQYYVKYKWNGEWSDWEEVNTKVSDTGWVPFNLINGTLANDAFKNESDNGFDCAYRIITNGSVTEKRVRINAKKIVGAQQIAELPEGFAKNVQFHLVRVPIHRGHGLIGIFPSGSVYAYVETDKRDVWTETDYFYGEISWKE